MRKLKSKKGLTLVELLVTVAVLGIVSGFSLTIVVTAMNNYTEAAILQKEQSTALMLEDYIVRNARVARQVQMLKDDVPSSTHRGFYIAKIDNVIQTFDYAGINTVTGEYDYLSTSTTIPQQFSRFTYENVQKITFEFLRQKNAVDNVEFKCVYCLEYTIVMMSGYQLSGQVVMNNADTTYLNGLAVDEGGASENFVDSLKAFNLIEVTDEGAEGYKITPENNTAVVFSTL